MGALGALALPAAAATDTGCTQANPVVTGRCRIVHGTVMPTADVGVILDVPGERTLVLSPPPRGGVRTRSKWKDPTNKWSSSDVVEGAFLVCPLPEQPNQFGRGFLRYGCIGKVFSKKITWNHLHSDGEANRTGGSRSRPTQPYLLPR